MAITPVYSYALGTSNPPTNLELFTDPVNAPRSYYREAAAFIDRADGSQSAQGYPWVVWEFDTLTQDMIDELRAICPGQSADVYLTTRIYDGSFDTFSGVMLWPSADQMEKRVGAENGVGIYSGLQFTFRRLVVVP